MKKINTNNSTIFSSENYRNSVLVRGLISYLHKITKHHWVIMEICGGQTHAIMQHGIDQLLPGNIELVHGPGCPVCVTSLELIDKAIAIASQENVIFTSYGDMLRVPGSATDLFSVRASGGNVKTVYSPLDAVRIARENPDKEVVFFAIGFETTAPANAISVVQAKKLGIRNYSILSSQVRVPPAMHAILGSPNNRVQGFLAAGHVCAVMGYWDYHPIAEKYGVPIVVTGFEPLDILQGITKTIELLESGHIKVENAYQRLVNEQGNIAAMRIIDEVYKSCNRQWRGIGVIPDSGYCLRDTYADYNAETKFNVENIQTKESEICISGLILQGLRKPPQCPAFGRQCTPVNPLGATMVSSEGACAAYYRYSRINLIDEHQ